MPAYREHLSDSEAGRPRTDYRDPLAGRRRDVRERPPAVVALVVRDERLEPADRDWDRLLADHAVPFAERFLRAEAAAHVRRGVGRAEDVSRAVDIAVLQFEERPGDVVVQRACDLAGRRRALNATVRLNLGRLEVIAFIHLEPVMDPVLRLLFGRRLMRHLQTRLTVYALYSLGVRHRHSTYYCRTRRRAV